MSKPPALSGRFPLSVFAAALLVACPPAYAREIFVSPRGDDLNAGTLDQPFATVARASALAAPGDTCFLRKSVYREVLRPGRSGEPGKDITFAAYQDEAVLLTGADLLGDWMDEGDGVWSAPMCRG